MPIKLNFAPILPLCLLLLSACKQSAEQSIAKQSAEFSNHRYYSLSAKQTGYESNYFDDYHGFGVELSLTTESDSLHPIHLMSCSWGSYLGHTTDSAFYVGYHNCDANFEYYQRITSKDTLRLLSVIATPNGKPFDKKDIRIGISLIDTLMVPIKDSLFVNLFTNEGKKEGSDYYKLINDPKNIVWSNPVTLIQMNKPISHSGRIELVCGTETSNEHCR